MGFYLENNNKQPQGRSQGRYRDFLWCWAPQLTSNLPSDIYLWWLVCHIHLKVRHIIKGTQLKLVRFDEQWQILKCLRHVHFIHWLFFPQHTWAWNPVKKNTNYCETFAFQQKNRIQIELVSQVSKSANEGSEAKFRPFWRHILTFTDPPPIPVA